MENVSALLERQRSYFQSGATRDVGFRLEKLKDLQRSIRKYEKEIAAALYHDLHKSYYESYASEIGLVLDEIRFIKKRLRKWAKPQERDTAIVNFPARSFVYPEPHGCVLIIAPWNYPFYLLMTPLVGAIAAGNCAIVKPSEVSVGTCSIIKRIIDETFGDEFVKTVEGGADVSGDLLKLKFDYIFFTGSTQVGKIVAEAATKNLTPVTLELGGKSPCIVDATADIRLAGRRIAWGKLINAGQTCIAPDYLYVHRSVKQPLVEAIRKNIENFFSADPAASDEYPYIINDKHFARLRNLMNKGDILLEGKTDASKRIIGPTIIDNVTWNDPVMQEEIFGPILPLLEFENIDEVISAVNSNPKPLALYLFTRNKKVKERIMNETSFGGGMINDTVEYIVSPYLPFGGVGNSGMGGYHGKASFDTFTHYKGVIRKSAWMDLPLRYPPYRNKKLWFLKWFLR